MHKKHFIQLQLWTVPKMYSTMCIKPLYGEHIAPG